MKVPMHRQTITQLADKADDFALSIAKTYMEFEGKAAVSWVDIGPSMPLIMNGKLHYTVTVTAGIIRGSYV